VTTPETPATESTLSTGGGGAAVATAREKNITPAPTPATRPYFNYPPPTQDRIRQRAYELFQQRGGQHGFDIQDWLKAEAEVTRR
jgi:hypothetical protein